MTRDHVNFLAGEVWSPNAAAIAPIASAAKVPFVIMNAAAAPITRLSPYIVRDFFDALAAGFADGAMGREAGLGRGL